MTGLDAEKTALHEFLEYQRISVRAILTGLDEGALSGSVAPFGWAPLGMVEHLGYAERHWFQELFVGSAVALPWAGEDPAPLTTPRPSSVVWDFYLDQCHISDAIIAANPLTATPARRHPDEPLGSQTTNLRRIMLHMIEETARHAGHLDAARQLIDGRTGLGPR